VNKYYMIFLAAVVVAAFGQVALKKGTAGESPFWRQYANPYVGAGYLMMFCSMGMVSFAYRGVPLKAGPVLESLGFIIVPLLSRAFFDEQITKSRFWGFVLIVIGVVIFSA